MSNEEPEYKDKVLIGFVMKAPQEQTFDCERLLLHQTAISEFIIITAKENGELIQNLSNQGMEVAKKSPLMVADEHFQDADHVRRIDSHPQIIMKTTKCNKKSPKKSPKKKSRHYMDTFPANTLNFSSDLATAGCKPVIN